MHNTFLNRFLGTGCIAIEHCHRKLCVITHRLFTKHTVSNLVFRPIIHYAVNLRFRTTHAYAAIRNVLFTLLKNSRTFRFYILKTVNYRLLIRRQTQYEVNGFLFACLQENTILQHAAATAHRRCGISAIQSLFQGIRLCHTAHKAREFARILPPQFELKTLADFPGAPDPEENGSTFEENALIKARAACAASGLPALADDSGLEVDALNGQPGIRSARYCEGSDADRVDFLLRKMETVAEGERGAQFVSAIACVYPDGTEFVVRGICRGEILRERHGNGGFGYDPIFYYPPLGKTTAELSPEEKNEVSHRGNALKVFYEKLKEAGYADK